MQIDREISGARRRKRRGVCMILFLPFSTYLVDCATFRVVFEKFWHRSSQHPHVADACSHAFDPCSCETRKDDSAPVSMGPAETGTYFYFQQFDSCGAVCSARVPTNIRMCCCISSLFPLQPLLLLRVGGSRIRRHDSYNRERQCVGRFVSP